jgi:hypothetical protein
MWAGVVTRPSGILEVVRVPLLPALALALATGCYRPAYDNTCFAACAGACPDNFACVDGRCQPTRAGLCDGTEPGGDGGDGGGGGGDGDTASTVCHGGAPFELCQPAGFTANGLDIVTFTTVDTGTSCTHVATLEGSTFAVCVVAAETIKVRATLRATGPRPLALWASTITVESTGTLDVSSVFNTTAGAGANDTRCATPVVGPEVVPNGGPGGPGGSFATAGAPGGAPGQPATSGVGPALPVTLDVPRGGCPGSDGGDSAINQGGNGGFSGGAVYLYADTILVDGHINASGAASNAAGLRGGGGGGGSGGVIVIAAATIAGSGHVLAAGAGGGGGGGATDNGTLGDTPRIATMSPPNDVFGGNHTMAGEGGFGGGTSGFSGGAVPHSGGSGTGDMTIGFSGGGGGAGGAGFVKVYESVALPLSIQAFPTP